MPRSPSFAALQENRFLKKRAAYGQTSSTLLLITSRSSWPLLLFLLQCIEQVFVPSCSSDSFSGHQRASDGSGGFHFQGGNIIQAVIQDLETRLGAATASLVLVGSGDAGKGVVEACDNLGKERAGRLRCVVDGGDVVPWWVEGEEEGCRERRQLEKEKQQVMPFF